MNEEKIKPIFDYYIKEWEYIASYHATIEWEKGLIDFYALIWKDGDFNAKIRLRMPSGQKAVLESVSFNSFEEILDSLKNRARDFPKSRFQSETIVKNPGNSGHSLLVAICDHFDIRTDYIEPAES